MHAHQSLWKDGRSRCSTTSRATPGLSDLARYYIGGILHHAPSLLAFTNPTVNSYKRLVPGYEAPINLVYSQRNRSACVRIDHRQSPKAKRLGSVARQLWATRTWRSVAMMMASLDGIRTKIGSRTSLPPTTRDPTSSRREEGHPAGPHLAGRGHRQARRGPQVPHRRWRVHRGLIETWIALKRENEIEPVQIRPHPYEFALCTTTVDPAGLRSPVIAERRPVPEYLQAPAAAGFVVG